MSVVLRGVAHPRGGCADAETVVEDGAWCAPASTAGLLGLGAHAPWICSQVEADLAASVPIAAREPHSRPRAVVCFPRPELAGKAGGQSFRITLLFLISLAVHRTQLPHPPDGARPPPRATHGHLFPQGAAEDGLLQHARSPRVGAVAVDAREGRRRRVWLVRRRPSQRGLHRGNHHRISLTLCARH